MTTLQQQIVQKFLAKLAETDALDAVKIEEIRILLTGTKKVTPDDLVKLFSQPVGSDTK